MNRPLSVRRVCTGRGDNVPTTDDDFMHDGHLELANATRVNAFAATG